MEDDFFLNKMKGVKPIKKDGTKLKIKKSINKNETIKKISETKKTNENIIRKNKLTKSEFNLSFGDLNKDLKRGKIKIDRKIDLHGFTLLDAYEKLKNEIKATYLKNKRCILVITGKGLYKTNLNEETKPKLYYGKIKNSIISWIKEEELKSYILTYQDAGFEYGGDGAIFIYLRKKKN